jgi:tetratricopeptide (TPR) repeat protein
MGIGLATDMATEITRYQEARVIIMKSPDAFQRRLSDTPARFIVEGSFQTDGSGIKVSVGLVDTKTHVQIWSGVYSTALEADRMISFQEEVAAAVGANIACEAGVISKTLSAESKNKPPQELKTYEAILKYYEFNLLFSAESFFRAFEALRFASEREPECGLVWSMLARLYAANYSLELLDLDTPIEKALSYAARGVHLEPANQRARLIMAYILLLKGDVDAGLSEVERGYRLNSNSILWLENIGYLMTLLGDWKRGPALIREALKHNPFYNVVVHYALWVDWIRQEKYRQAYTETFNFRLPGLFWDPLMKAAACGLTGNREEGRRTAADLLALKPDFPRRGRDLIGHYIKFDDIAERTVEGLAGSGIGL